VELMERLAMRMYRARRCVAPAVLVASFVITQVLFRMPKEGLKAGRWLLGPYVLLAAAFLWPLGLKRHEPLPVRLGIVAVLSAATVLVTLLVIPLWAGHGCWAADLNCFGAFLLAGLVLALVASLLSVRWRERLEHCWVGWILIFFLLTFCFSVAVTLVRAHQALPATLAGPRPEVLWSRMPWQALRAYLAPLPWVHPGYAPADPAVGRNVVVFLGTPERVDILDSRDGSMVWSASVQPPGHSSRSGTARNLWMRPVVSGRHILLRPQLGTALLILDLDSRRIHSVDLGETAVGVLPAEAGGFYVLTPSGLYVLDGTGAVQWSYRPKPPVAPHRKVVRFSVNEFSPPSLRCRLANTPGGLVGMNPDWLFLCDPQAREVKWIKFPRGRFAGLQVSPSGEAICVAEIDPGGQRIVAYDSSGAPMWSRQLAAECHGIVWVAAADGILVWERLPGAGPAEYVGWDGQTRYWIPIPERAPVSVQYLGGIFLVATHHQLSAYRAADGEHLWTITEAPGSRRPGGYLYYLDWAIVGDYLIVPRTGGLSAHNLLTGSLRWVYTPPGGFFGMAAGSDAVYVASSRGLFALRGR